MNEVWMDVKDYEGKYQISNKGRVYSINSNKYLAQSKTHDGYLKVKLFKEGKARTEYIHRLVARHFLDNPDNLPQVNHIDENRENNIVSNLEWTSAKSNNNHGSHNARIAKAHCKPVRCVELNRVFESAKAAEQELSIFATAITAVCRGERQTAGGYHWERI